MSTTTKRPGLLINRNFALLFLGQGISQQGDTIFSVTLTLIIAYAVGRGQSWAPLAASGVVIATALPSLLVRPLAGVFVDRWDKRKTMLWNDAIRAVLIALLIPVLGNVTLPFVDGGALPLGWKLGIVYGVVLLSSTAAQFFNPSLLALTGDLVPEAQRGRAFGLDYFTTNVAFILGPPIAAALFLFGAEWALLINAFSFVFSFLMVAIIRAPRSAHGVASGERRNARREFSEGLRFYLHSAVLRTLTIALCIGVLGFGALNGLNVFFVQRRLGGDEQMFAGLAITSGASAILGSLVAGWVVERVGAARIFGLSVLLLGCTVLVLSQVTFVPLAFGLTALLGIWEAFLNVAIGPVLLSAAPRELVGRVSSIFQPLYATTALLSVALAGYLASNVLSGFHTSALGLDLDAITTIFAGCGALGVIAGIYALLNLRLLTPATSSPDVATAAIAE